MNAVMMSANIAANPEIQGQGTCARTCRQNPIDAGSGGGTSFAKIFDNAQAVQDSNPSADAVAAEDSDAAVQVASVPEEEAGISSAEGFEAETTDDAEIEFSEEDSAAGLALGHILQQTQDRTLIRQYIEAAFLNREQARQGVSEAQTVQAGEVDWASFDKSHGMHLAVGQIFQRLRIQQAGGEGDNLSDEQGSALSKAQADAGDLRIQTRSAFSDIQAMAVEASLSEDSQIAVETGQDSAANSLWQTMALEQDAINGRRFLSQKHLKSSGAHAVKESAGDAQKSAQSFENIAENPQSTFQSQVASVEENLSDQMSARFEDASGRRGSDYSDIFGKISNLTANAEKPFAVAAQNQTQALNPEFSLLRSQQIVDQVLANSQQVFSQGSGRIKLVLNPPDLGTVDMDVRLRNNKVEVIMVAAKAEVQLALQSHADQLKSAFQAQGLQVDSFDVLCFADSDPRSFEGNAFTGRGGRGDSKAGQQGSSSESIQTSRKTIQMTDDSGISVFA